MNLIIDIHTHNDFFEQFENSWNWLLKRSNSDSIFLTWEWVSIWWKVYGEYNNLYILLIKDMEERLLGIAPLKISKKQILPFIKIRTLEFIGTGEEVTPEYLDFIIKKGHEKEVIKAIVEYLVSNCDWDIYNFRPIHESSANIPHLKKYFLEKPLKLKIKNSSICPIVKLPDSWENFYRKKSRNFRKKMGEYNRIVKRDLNLELIKCNSLDELNHYYKHLIILHHKRWNGSSQAFRSEKYIQFHRLISELLIDKDRLRMFLLRDEKSYVAGIYCYFYNKQYYYYQSGRDLKYDKYRVGIVLLNMVMKEAIKEGATNFDFLTGDEPYKFRWANSLRNNINLICWQNGKIYILMKVVSMFGSISHYLFNLIHVHTEKKLVKKEFSKH